MRRFIVFLGILVAAGCLSVPEQAIDLAKGTGGLSSKSEPLPETVTAGGPGPCGGTQYEPIMLGGEIYYMEVPVLCDPYVKDRGDPPPERGDFDMGYPAEKTYPIKD